MFAKSDKSDNSTKRHNFNSALHIRKMLIEKYQLQDSRMNIRFNTSTPDYVEFVFFNGMSSAAETDKMDDANRKPVEFLEGHDCKSFKETAGLDYLSNTVITVPVDKFHGIKESLKLLEQISAAEHSSQSTAMAKC